jgi:hypothetical protein
MIKNKLVSKTIYFSLFVQIVTTLISLDGLNYNLNKEDSILKIILILEAFVQLVEGIFYVWVIYALKDLKIMTPRRYIDWFVTTPTMLFTTIVFMEYLKQKEKNNYFTISDFIKNHKQNIIIILSCNFFMLLFGYLGEIKLLNNNLSVSLGFIFFFIAFKVIYDNYAKYNQLSYKLFIFLIIIWGLYGIASLMPLINKNISYNLLDIVSKNFYGLFIYYYITQISNRK